MGRLLCYMFCYRSEQNADFEEAAGLRRIGAARAEGQSRGQAGCPDMGELQAGIEYLVLVSRRHGYRPCVAPRTAEQIGCAGCGAARAGNIFEPNRQADAAQWRVGAKGAIVCITSGCRRQSK